MTTQFTLPPDTRAVFDGDPASDMNAVVDALKALGVLYNVLNAANAGGADPTGAADCTAAINAASAAGVGVLPPGTFKINGSTPLTGPLKGSGYGLTNLEIGSSFSGAAAVVPAADFAEISDLAIIGTSGTTTSNPAAHGIQINGFAHVTCRNLWFQHVNGYCIEAVGQASATNVDLMVSGIIGRNCAAGVHLKGASGTSFLGEHMISRVTLQQMGVASGTYANLDAFFCEDITDVEISQLNIGLASSQTGSAVHIKGACAGIYLTNPDCGSNAISGGSPALHIESGSNGTPNDVAVTNGSFEGGLTAFTLDAGTAIRLLGTRFHQAYSDGMQVNGGTLNAAGTVCASNNQGNVTAYDINTSGQGSGSNAYFTACSTESTVGSGAGLVTNPVSTSTHSYYLRCLFVGTNTTPSTVFTGTPQKVEECVGYNPRGAITAPTITASPFTSSTSQQPVTIIFTAINTLTAFKIAGTAVGVLPVAGVPYTIPARTALELDYSGAAPTWQWFGC